MIAKLLVLILMRSAACSVYFHELSKVTLKPSAELNNSEFGLSMGYQGGKSRKIIVGAPHADLVGKVFQCDIRNILVNQTNFCDHIPIEVDTLAPYNRSLTPDLKLNLGASIAATPDYFLTCAPLWTATLNGTVDNYPFGTCFVYDGSVHRFQGTAESDFTVEHFSRSIHTGGVGWKMLVDEINDNLIIAKSQYVGDFLYINASNPWTPAESYSTRWRKSRIERSPLSKLFESIGYAMTAGQFFNPNRTLYAFSATTSTSRGAIYFLRADTQPSGKILKLIGYSKDTYINLTESGIGTMFGAALHAADLNKDGLSELIVGAPAQDDNEGGFEMGTLHIFLGGIMSSLNVDKRHRVILGTENGARFGTAIATNDVDGDGFSEIFVSAPYDGTGVLYILSGFEIDRELLRYQGFKKISLSKLKLTQKIQAMNSTTFGRSLKVIPDLDDNGCDELAVGSPGSNDVVLLRCLPAVNVTVTAELVGKRAVKEQDNSFVVGVCIDIRHMKQRNFSAELTVSNEIMGNQANIKEGQRDFVVKFSEENPRLCRNISVILNDHEPGEYRFTTAVKMNEETMLKTSAFNRSWVTLSPQSVMEASVEVSRHCSGTDCDPDLSMSIQWDSEHTKDGAYEVGSSDSLSINLIVANNGSSSFDACTKIRVEGAPVALIGCGKSDDGYKCYMQKPFRRYKEQSIIVKLNTSRLTNMDKFVHVEAQLYQFCDRPSDNETSYESWLLLTLNTSQVAVQGTSYDQTVSDAEIEDTKKSYVQDVQEYLVINEGSVTWMSITAIVTVKKQSFIDTSRIFFQNQCQRYDTNETVSFNCTYDLKPHTTSKFIAINDIPKDKILNNLLDGKLKIETNFSLFMTPTDEVKVSSLISTIEFQSELSFGNNKGLVIFLAILGALIILAVVVFVLYKIGFFKRNEKTRLEALKQDHIRRQSVVKHSTSGSPNSGSDDFVEMEVEDDSPFEIVDMSEPVLKEHNTKE